MTDFLLPFRRIWQAAQGRHGNMNFNQTGGKAGFVLRFFRWQWNAFFGQPVGPGSNEKCTVILLAHNRMRNMRPMVRSLLKCAFVEKIIVCNTNPSFDISRYVTIRDDRVSLMNTDKKFGPIKRYLLAREEDSEYFISIDDDTFLYPEQVFRLFRMLVRYPEVPHGIWGQVYEGEGEDGPQFTWNVFGRDVPVDILNRVHAFTRKHITGYFDVLEKMGIEDTSKYWHRAITDLPLAFCVQKRPRCHDFGSILQCPTESSPGIAQWTHASFRSDRNDLFMRLMNQFSMERPPRGFYCDAIANRHIMQWKSFERFVKKGIRFRFIQPWMPLPKRLCQYIQWHAASFRVRNVRIRREYRHIASKVNAVQSVSGLSSYAMSLLVQAGVSAMPSDEVFLQIGTWKGYLFFSGVIGNENKRMIGVDNFSGCGNARLAFHENFKKYASDTVRFEEQDSLRFLERYDGPKIGFLAYDGDHDFQVQYDHLALAMKHLAPGAMILIDDTNLSYTRGAVIKFLRENPYTFKVVTEKRTACDMHPTWWNGFMLLQYTP